VSGDNELWSRIVSFENILVASRAARRGKRFRESVLAFEHNVEREVLRLQDELLTKRWAPGPYREFYIHEPKKRKISAAPYRDRVVHHALVRVIEPIFERDFIAHSYACRRGKGTHRAIDRFEALLRSSPWCLKMDVEKFFASIDHKVLLGLVERKISCPDTLWLVRRIVDGSNPQERVWRYFAGDDLFTPVERRLGIPIGNLTSQFFANVMLDPLDHFVTEELRIDGYVRYCDDLAVFADSKERLLRARSEIVRFLAQLRLSPHRRKCHVFPARHGSPFLGFRVLRTHRRLLPEKVGLFRRRARRQAWRLQRGDLSLEAFRASIASWIAHVSAGDTWALRRSLLSQMRITR